LKFPKFIDSIVGMAEYNTFQDTELVDLLKSGDHAAFTEIFHRYSPLLYSHANNKLRNDTEARDVVQEIFVKLWAKREELDLKTNLPGVNTKIQI